MKINAKLYILLITLGLFLLSSAVILPLPRAANEKFIFLKAEKDDRTIWLFGNIGSAFTPDVYPLPQRIMQAFQDSDLLIHSYNQKPVNYDKYFKVKRNWANHLGEEESQHLVNRFERYGMNSEGIALLQTLAPWAAAGFFFEQVVQKRGGFNAENPELFFSNLASQHNMSQQFINLVPIALSFIKNMQRAEELATVNWYLGKVDYIFAGQNLMQALQLAWMRGDTETVLALLVISENPDFPEIKALDKKMYATLTTHIMKVIMTEAKKHKTLFVTLPADMLLVHGGLIHALQDKGYTINPA
jgi:uncharacterized protein YbaP (TraB family)